VSYRFSGLFHYGSLSKKEKDASLLLFIAWPPPFLVSMPDVAAVISFADATAFMPSSGVDFAAFTQRDAAT